MRNGHIHRGFIVWCSPAWPVGWTPRWSCPVTGVRGRHWHRTLTACGAIAVAGARVDRICGREADEVLRRCRELGPVVRCEQ